MKDISYKRIFAIVLIVSLIYILFFVELLIPCQPFFESNLSEKVSNNDTIQVSNNDTIRIIHLVQGDKRSVDEYPSFNHLRNHFFGNDMIYYYYPGVLKKNIIDTFLNKFFKINKDKNPNYYDKRLNVYNIYSSKHMSWTEGRNYLLQNVFEFEKQNVFKSDIQYEYFAFFDDDVLFKIIGTNRTNKNMITSADWIKIYEMEFKKELIKYKPAIMTVQKCCFKGFPLAFDKTHCESKSCSISHHDAIAVWIHRELIQNIFAFPYSTDLDDICWYESQRILWNMAYSMYFNHILMFRELFYVINPEHREYPRDANKGKRLSYNIIKSKQNELYGNEWMYHRYYYNETGGERKETFKNHPQYKYVGYPMKKGQTKYNNYTAFNNTKPIIPY